MLPNVLRQRAEIQYQQELEALAKADTKSRPDNWRLSPRAVVDFVIGAKRDGLEISPKYVGSRQLIEVAVATLVTDRALLLVGTPGTAKTWVSELLAAAICGDSSLLVQGTAGTDESAVRYGWNYARLIAEGPKPESMVASPVLRAMESGKIARLEEITRIPGEIQDSLITTLSEKVISIPELGSEVAAIRGFNVIATANDRDKGVHDLSHALRRRFNTVHLPLPATLEEEVKIVSDRVIERNGPVAEKTILGSEGEINRILLIFRELRDGKTADGKVKLKSPSATLSTAEAIGVVESSLAMATHFGDGTFTPTILAQALYGSIVRDQSQDSTIWLEYLETVMKTRTAFGKLYTACIEDLKNH